MPRNEVLLPPLEIWGGVECSHVRVGDTIRDQCVETGHWHRPGDLDLLAETGLRTMRYPVVWGTVASSNRLDFGWHDARLARIRTLGIRPIVGLLHHGWGPGEVHALHPDFVETFASYAEAVACRYPWIRDYTPINEPVTTARFSYLYGHWYPHLRDEGAFLRAVVACAQATAEAMRRIRWHRPNARLVQTEDFGRVFASGPLQYQADYENERRFLAADLLTGRVGRDHPLCARLLDAGVAASHLALLRDEPCVPDLLGLDYYLTSDRFLDLDIGRHPPEAQGGNDRNRYADTAAFHEPDLLPHLGYLPRLNELHDRYALPLAVTEAHAACTREEQVRWLCEAWTAAQRARADGVPVVAVTNWAMFGAIDWASLLLRQDGLYESGAFDLRDGQPRRTAVGDMVASLCKDGEFRHPVTAGAGWWTGKGPESSGLSVSVSGLEHHRAALGACCLERGIAVVRRTDEPSGHLRIDGTAEGLRSLRLHHPASAVEVVRDVETACDLHLHAHSLLDHLVDLCVSGGSSEPDGEASEAPAAKPRAARPQAASGSLPRAMP